MLSREISLRSAFGCFAFVLALTIASVSPTLGDSAFSLAKVREQVRQDYSQVKHLVPEALTRKLADEKNILLLDVREGDEFAVSHIAGAKRVDPGIWRWTFMNKFEKAAAGKTVVFYCSVGVRSSKLAARVQSALLEAGAKAVYNLDGGIFAWHNEQRPLIDIGAPTQFVHPYDSNWGRLVARQSFTRMAPARQPGQ